jgi:hypothetical protein
MDGADKSPNTNPAARFVVFVFAIVFFALAVAAYFHEPAGFTTPVYGLGAVGGAFLFLALLGSQTACDTTVHLLTLGVL